MTAIAHRLAGLAKALRRNESGVAFLEFAMIFPIMMFMGLYGIELARMSMVTMRVSQIALAVADNASRMEQTNNSAVAPTVTEADITSVLIGATKEGSGFNFSTNGRVILTSLEKHPTSGKQYIHWQRCIGSLNKSSKYGNETTLNGINGPTITALGNGSTKAVAPDNIGVMFVEVYYAYTPIFGSMFVKNTTFKQEAAYIVRDIRDYRHGQTPVVTPSGTKSGC
jgi:hypothetical protein